MPDLLLELFSEEIPARMQAKAVDDLRRMVTDRLIAEGLVYDGAKAFATPRRLALTVHGIPARQSDLKEERKGPRVGGPEAAIQGFLKATGLASLDEAKIQRDPKKGDFYVALIEKPGRATLDVLAEIIPTVILSFPWPKSMRWGSKEQNLEESYLVTEQGDRIVTERGDGVVVDTWLKWVRPLHSIVATFGLETEEPEVVQFTIGGIKAGQTTFGHRFMAPAPIPVRRFDDYQNKLQAAKVMLDSQARKNRILADARSFAFVQGFELVEDQGLLDEVAGLVEWPEVLMGSFDDEFLSIPPEVIRATIRNNQKCFVISDPKTEKLTNKFVLTANIVASDGGKAIIAGNERVIRARLSDAKFFYETDLKTRLEDRLPKFDSIVFHEKLGTQGERVARIELLAAEIALTLWKQRETSFRGMLLGADKLNTEEQYILQVERAARLAKADLLTEVVGEFPELQGLMGKYYALAQGEHASVAAASEEHYKPQGPADRVPTDPVSVAVALADKIDTLLGFWIVDEKPTGSKDPFALRRAVLGVIRILLESRTRFALTKLFKSAYLLHLLRIQKDGVLVMLSQGGVGHASITAAFSDQSGSEIVFDLSRPAKVCISRDKNKVDRHTENSVTLTLGIDHYYDVVGTLPSFGQVSEGLLSFFADRLKVQLREQGARHDLVDAVFALEGQDDLLMVVRRVEALGKFLDTDDGKNLLAGTKRAANILRIEEKKDGKAHDGAPDPALYSLGEEKTLAKAIEQVRAEASAAVAREDFAAAMSAMAKLRPAVDAFFDKVKVNDDDPQVRENRLKLLNEIRVATRAVADFSKIQD